MGSKAYMGVRISRRLKRLLEEEARIQGETLSEVVRKKLEPGYDIY